MGIVIRVVEDIGCILHCHHPLVHEDTLIGRTGGEVGKVFEKKKAQWVVVGKKNERGEGKACN